MCVGGARATADRAGDLVFGATRFVVVRPLAGCSRGAHAWRLPPCGSSLMMSQKKAEMWENGPSLQ